MKISNLAYNHSLFLCLGSGIRTHDTPVLKRDELNQTSILLLKL